MMNKLKLHLGCGEKNFEGFINVDLSDYEHIHYKNDIRQLDMFANETVDLIYCCHALEYFDRLEVIDVMDNWSKKLKTGGVLRLSVPNFASIVQIYQKYGDLEHQGILGPLYGKWKSNGTETLYHRTVYDEASLTKLLKKVGFSDIKIYNPHETEHSEYDDYSMAYVPHMDKRGILLSLNIECRKV